MIVFLTKAPFSYQLFKLMGVNKRNFFKGDNRVLSIANKGWTIQASLERSSSKVAQRCLCSSSHSRLSLVFFDFTHSLIHHS